jgi:hypothetical protein
MKPQNSAERSKSLTRFILFYIISVLAIVTAVFFGLQVPFKQNKQLTAQLKLAQQESDFDRKFYMLLDHAKRNLDSVNSQSAQTEVIEADIEADIKKMIEMLNTDAITSTRLYRRVIDFITTAKADKRTLRSNDKAKDLGEAVAQLQDLKAKLEANKMQYDQLKANYENLQQQSLKYSTH